MLMKRVTFVLRYVHITVPIYGYTSYIQAQQPLTMETIIVIIILSLLLLCF